MFFLKDLPAQIKKVASFLGKQLTSSETDALVEHLSFSNFKKNPAVNGHELFDAGYFKKGCDFVRKGNYNHSTSSILKTRNYSNISHR